MCRRTTRTRRASARWARTGRSSESRGAGPGWTTSSTRCWRRRRRPTANNRCRHRRRKATVTRTGRSRVRPTVTGTAPLRIGRRPRRRRRNRRTRRRQTLRTRPRYRRPGSGGPAASGSGTAPRPSCGESRVWRPDAGSSATATASSSVRHRFVKWRPPNDNGRHRLEFHLSR